MDNLHVAIRRVKDLTSLTYSAQNLCQVLSENKHNDLSVYFDSQHSLYKVIEKNTNMQTIVKETNNDRINILQSPPNSSF